jgi:hypothetical protein
MVLIQATRDAKLSKKKMNPFSRRGKSVRAGQLATL